MTRVIFTLNSYLINETLIITHLVRVHVSSLVLLCVDLDTWPMFHQCLTTCCCFSFEDISTVFSIVCQRASHTRLIQLCGQTHIYWRAVQRLLSCLHSPSYSANSRAWEFVQVVTVEQLISSVWHKVMSRTVSKYGVLANCRKGSET